ncbi:MAG: GAF domain-containing protein [Candidatus Scalindua sp.]|nr:GAF domain-containing protein [Candidatus Scalindua sp.]
MANPTFTVQPLIKTTKSEITEILLGFVIMIAINILWFQDSLGFYGIRYHPYWIVILAVATRYGFRGGLTAGIMGGVLLLVLMKVGEPDMAVKQFLRYKYLETPVLFIIVGTFIGELREMQKRQFAELYEVYAEVQNSLLVLTKKYDAVITAKQELDTRIVGQEQTISTLYESALALKSLKEEDIYPAVLKIVKEFISAEECSIYKATTHKLKLVVNGGWKDDNSYATETDLDEGLMGRAFTTGKTATITDMLNGDEPHSFSDVRLIVSAPIMNSKKVVTGVLNIEKMPFVKFNPQSIKMASLLADWCGSAVENARTYQESKDHNIADEITGAYTYEYLCIRMEEEFNKAYRYKFIFGILVLEIVEYDVISETKIQEIMPVFSTVFRNAVRKTDLLFVGSNPGSFVFLFPFTPIKGIAVVKNKLIQSIHEFKFRPFEDGDRLLEVYAGMAEFNDKLAAYGELLQVAVDDVEREKRIKSRQLTVKS